MVEWVVVSNLNIHKMTGIFIYVNAFFFTKTFEHVKHI
jgi:hypothetical protein